MQNRILGKSRIAVSEIGLGCWQFGGDFGPVSTNTVNDILDHAVAQGFGQHDRLFTAFDPRQMLNNINGKLPRKPD